VLATSIPLPTVEAIRKLSIMDLAIAADLAYEIRNKLQEYVHIDPYCVRDPFGEKDDYNYSVILDKENPNRVLSILVNRKDSLPQLPWSTIIGTRLAKMMVSKDDGLAIKHELAPKETNNFYPYRRNGRITGYLMFAFQICGQH
jgi:hypothetical protein